MNPAATDSTAVAIADLWPKVQARLVSGARFAGLYGTAADTAEGAGLRLTALLAEPDTIAALDAHLPAGAARYPSLAALLPAAFWYEREIHDLFGIVPDRHPRLDPLVLPLNGEGIRPRPGAPDGPARLEPNELVLPRRVMGPGMFTIPHGPVRSGVFEAVEYLVETPGEDISHVQVRVFAKHRGVEKRFEGMDVDTGVLLAERVEGIASVAHALAFAHACETLADIQLPAAAELIRVLHAELERAANHLDVTMRLSDAAGLAVATARFAWHKERVLRLVGRLCGGRFGRGVVVPGGVRALPLIPAREALSDLAAIDQGVRSDARALMESSSFLDRLRGTGPLEHDLARAHGALGPVGRASGAGDDARRSRPYDAYPRLDLPAARTYEGTDVQARTRVRFDEINTAFDLARQTLQALDAVAAPDALRVPVQVPDGRGIGWAEAPQGELLYALDVAHGVITRCKPRTASFHNLVLFHETFQGDVLTDFPFIEASFGLSIAGVVG
jgi:formate hydrogenlyase subunit 5